MPAVTDGRFNITLPADYMTEVNGDPSVLMIAATPKTASAEVRLLGEACSKQKCDRTMLPPMWHAH